MQEQTARKGYLILENGKVFEGFMFGAETEAVGELVFTTNMVGYLENLTDSNFYGQIVIQTFPLIGNYGVISSDLQSARPQLKAYIVREWCQQPSNFRAEGELDTFLKQEGIPGLYGIDTRALTRILREEGVLNAKLSFTLHADDGVLASLKNFKIENAVKQVEGNMLSPRLPQPEEGANIAFWDFGSSVSVADELISRGCKVNILPASSSAEEILAVKPDGIFLSDGPGDPRDNDGIIAQIAKIAKSGIPVFGIGLGHQLLALAMGAKTEKLKYGHRGASQPCSEPATGRTFITSQNHGYAVTADSLPDNAQISFVNANDGTCEGIEYTDIPAFSVQFRPECSGGAKDTSFLYGKFADMAKNNKY